MDTPAGFRRCTCAEGERLRSLENQRDHPVRRDPVLTAKDAGIFTEMLASIPYFPSEAGARLMIADEIRAICENPEAALWLIRRMVRLYKRWPGPREMRLVYCSKSLPLDGLIESSISEFYPEGIPAEVEESKQKLLPPAPRDREVTAAASVQAAIVDLARAKGIEPTRRPKVRDIPSLPPGVKPIGQAEIDAAVQKLRESKGTA